MGREREKKESGKMRRERETKRAEENEKRERK